MIKKNQLPNEYNDTLNAQGAFFVINICLHLPLITKTHEVNAWLGSVELPPFR